VGAGRPAAHVVGRSVPRGVVEVTPTGVDLAPEDRATPPDPAPPQPTIDGLPSAEGSFWRGQFEEPCDAGLMVTGACLCGALRYEAAGLSHSLTHCHCSMCRKHHGAPFSTLATAPAHSFRWQSGEASVLEYRSSTARVRRFCGVCGSVAPAAMKGDVLLPAGNLVGELGEVDGLHLFVGSKAPWHIIADDLPQYDTVPPGWDFAEAVRPAQPQRESGIHGSCLCGAVTFSVKGSPARWFQCHCSRCRRARSAAHGSNAFYPASQFEWRTGRELVRSYRPPDAERFMVSFCERCGGGAPVERDNVPFVLVPTALFDGDPGARPEAHIHVASKASWYRLSDGLPQFAELPPP
jgi:hypothetical protein